MSRRSRQACSAVGAESSTSATASSRSPGSPAAAIPSSSAADSRGSRASSQAADSASNSSSVTPSAIATSCAAVISAGSSGSNGTSTPASVNWSRISRRPSGVSRMAPSSGAGGVTAPSSVSCPTKTTAGSPCAFVNASHALTARGARSAVALSWTTSLISSSVSPSRRAMKNSSATLAPGTWKSVSAGRSGAPVAAAHMASVKTAAKVEAHAPMAPSSPSVHSCAVSPVVTRPPCGASSIQSTAPAYFHR